MKKILIDANPIVPFYSLGINNGIGRTNMELIKSLDSFKDEIPFNIELFTQNLRGISAKKLNTGFKTRHLYLRNTDSQRELSKRLHLRELISGYDLQHITHNYEIVTDPSKCIVTVHDAFFMKFEVPNFDYKLYRKLYPPFIKACKHIITPSEYSKKDIMETMDIPGKKITVIPWGIDHNSFYPEKKEESKNFVRNRFSIKKPFFLSVSCDAGRKRTDKLIEAYLNLENPKNELVLVWSNPTEAVLSKINNNSKIHLLSNLKNEELRHLYNAATASVNPTSYEGFGLPVLEAMACGCPVVTCNNSSIPEVGGDACIYVPEPIEKHLSEVLSKIDKGDVDLSELRKKSIEQASKFSWERTARETVHVYQKVLTEYAD